MSRFIPLSIPNFEGNEKKYVDDALDQGWVSTGGAYITELEKKLAEFMHTDNVAACQSGTSALHMSLAEAGVRPGDVVLVPPLTFIAAVNPVKYQFATPVFIDCDESFCMDPVKLREFCETQCTFTDGVLYFKEKPVKALVVVHVFGNMADMEAIMETAEKYDLNLAYYEKQQQVINIYRNYNSVRSHEEDLYMYAGHMKQGDEEHQADNRERWTFNVEVALTRILYDGSAVVRDYNRYGLDDVFLGNEERLKEMYDFSTTVFNLAGFTEEEIQELSLGEKSPIWDDLYQKLVDYYWEEIM